MSNLGLMMAAQMERGMNALWKKPPSAPPKEETLGQRALRAAETINSPGPGYGKRRFAQLGRDVSHLITREEAAANFGLRPTAVGNAKYLLAHGTPEEIEGVRSGRNMLDPMVRSIKLRKPETRRPRATPEARERRLLTGVIWGQLRGALDGLATLPSARDCAKLFATRQAWVELINKQLPKAKTWLQEFEEEWSKRDE